MKKNKNVLLQILKNKLSRTDYIIVKLQEYQLQSKDISQLLVHYKPQLDEREKIREEIRQLEEELLKLKK